MKGSSRRPEQMAETLRQVITEALAREVRDPRVGFVTVTGVLVSNDLSHARVMVSTSSPGMSLMAEAMSYMAGSETPVVLVNVMLGASPVGYREFLIGTALGMVAMVVALAGFGYQLTDTQIAEILSGTL